MPLVCRQHGSFGRCIRFITGSEMLMVVMMMVMVMMMMMMMMIIIIMPMKMMMKKKILTVVMMLISFDPRALRINSARQQLQVMQPAPPHFDVFSPTHSQVMYNSESAAL